MPALPTPLTELPLVEAFSSIQGEGPWVGVRQAFIRLSGCNLACDYCDTGFDVLPEARIEQAPGSGLFRSVANPLPVETLTVILHDWFCRTPGLHHSISLTGGEPLLHAAALTEWLPVLRELRPIYLETNGTLAKELTQIRRWVDYLSMDLKLPSVAGAGDLWEQHREFLQAAQGLDGYVKIVVHGGVRRDEVEQAARLLATFSAERALILQPVTRDGRPDMPPHLLLELQQAAAAIHGRVRVIPQVHPILAVG